MLICPRATETYDMSIARSSSFVVLGDRKKLYFVWNSFTFSIRSADLINREKHINQQTNLFFYSTS